jgi:hypothetical protein
MILTDMGGDPDDQQSLVRLLHYANEFEIEGLIATASGTPGELKQKVTRPDLIRELVVAYGQVRDALAKQADGYPAAEALLSVVKSGNPERGRQVVGQKHDTDGSRWILAAVDRADPRPLCIAIWGGQTDLAQALWRVREDRGLEGLAKIVSRLRVYDVADQDGIAAWIQEQFWLPAMQRSGGKAQGFYIQAGAPAGRDKREGVFRGMYLGGDESLVSREWMETHIRQNHGPLGALYPPRTWTAPNPHSAIKEGDTPSWFYFLPHGLNDAEHPEWGGFGGRFERRSDGIYRDAVDTVDGTTDARATVWRWRRAYQADFQARLDWAAGRAATVNHAPRAALNGDSTRAVLRKQVKPGELIELSASGADDPDHDELSFRWFVYREPSHYPGPMALMGAETATAMLRAPDVEAATTIHVLLEVTDNGHPPLTAFRRIVIDVE